MRRMITALCLVLAAAPTASAEVTRVWITSRSVVADGRAFGSTGPYERLAGRIQHKSRIERQISDGDAADGPDAGARAN